MDPGHDTLAHRVAFDREQKATLWGFRSAVVVDVILDEWALFGPDEAMVFSHPDLPFVQAARVQIAFEDGRKLQIGIWQDDDHWALHFAAGAPQYPFAVNKDPGAAISRLRRLRNVPVGRIKEIEPWMDDRGTIQELWMRIGDRILIFKAGEVDEDLSGRLNVCSADESVLIFCDESDYLRTSFNNWVYRTETRFGAAQLERTLPVQE